MIETYPDIMKISGKQYFTARGRRRSGAGAGD
jgi:hypothetical protein